MCHIIGKKYKIFFVLSLIIILSLSIIHRILLNTSYKYNEILDKRAFKEMVKVIVPENIRLVQIEISYQSNTLSNINLKYEDELFSNIMFYKWNNKESNWKYLPQTHSNDRFTSIYFLTDQNDSILQSKEDIKIGPDPFFISMRYRDGLFSDISFHKSLWNYKSLLNDEDETNTIYIYIATVHLNDRFSKIDFMTKDLNSAIFGTYFNGRRFSVSIPSLKRLFEEYEEQKDEYFRDYFRQSDSGDIN